VSHSSLRLTAKGPFALLFPPLSILQVLALDPQLNHSLLGFKITPRKGQFLVYKLPQRQQGQAQGQLMTIEPVATQFTKGVILWQTLYGNVIVGPTADDVLEKDDYATDTETLRRLQQFGEKVYPLLKEAEVIGSYSGLRPASEYRDYQIYSNANEDKKWITVGGIRSTGESFSINALSRDVDLDLCIVRPHSF
jgi:glycerol-3-phosphate dehydrogenase